MNKVIHIFTKVDMRLGHPGLKALAAKQKVNVGQLELGEYVLFANNRLTGMKIFAANNTVVYCKAPNWRPFDIRAMHALPQFIEGTEINYDGAMKQVLLKEYGHLFNKAKEK